MRVVEKIDVDFSTLSKHGITREIPYIYEDKYGEKNKKDKRKDRKFTHDFSFVQ